MITVHHGIQHGSSQNGSSLSLHQGLGSQHWQVSGLLPHLTAELHNFWTAKALLILCFDWQHFGVVWGVFFVSSPVLFFLCLGWSLSSLLTILGLWRVAPASLHSVKTRITPERFHTAFLPLSCSSLTENLKCQGQFLSAFFPALILGCHPQ